LKDNGVLTKDNKKTKSKKRRRYKKAEKSFMAHLNDLAYAPMHGLYDGDKVFPKPNFIWNGNAYDEGIPEETTEKDRLFLEALRQEKEEFVPTHWVGAGVSVRRDGDGPKSRKEAIDVGHIVVFRLQSWEEGDLPWCVGEVMAKNVSSTATTLTICEYGSEGRQKEQKTENILWGATFRGTEPHRFNGQVVEHEEFWLNTAAKSSTKNMKPVLLEMEDTVIAEWDTPEEMFCLPRGQKNRKDRGRKLKKWVLNVLSEHKNVEWVRDKPPKAGKKRKQTEKANNSSGSSTSTDNSDSSSDDDRRLKTPKETASRAAPRRETQLKAKKVAKKGQKPKRRGEKKGQ
jgi:hypothetical protein